MYKHHKIKVRIFFIASITILYMIDIRLTQNFIGYLINFFSIVFGFYMTVLSILFRSDFTKNLWKKEDPRIEGQRKIHTLIKYFKSSLFLLLLSIVLFLIISLTGMMIDSNYKIIPEYLPFWGYSYFLERAITALLLGIALTNIIFIILLLKIFFNALLEQSSMPK